MTSLDVLAKALDLAFLSMEKPKIVESKEEKEEKKDE